MTVSYLEIYNEQLCDLLAGVISRRRAHKPPSATDVDARGRKRVASGREHTASEATEADAIAVAAFGCERAAGVLAEALALYESSYEPPFDDDRRAAIAKQRALLDALRADAAGSGSAAGHGEADAARLKRRSGRKRAKAS